MGPSDVRRAATPDGPARCRRAAAAALLAGLAILASPPARAASVGWEVGVAAGYGDNLYLTVDPVARQGAPRLSAWAGTLAVFPVSEAFAAWANGALDGWLPVGHEIAASHGLTLGVGGVWLVTDRLSLDLAPWAMVRLYAVGLDPALLVGASASAQLTLSRTLSAQVTGYYVNHLSSDPVLANGAGGAGPGLEWRPSKRLRVSAEYTLETGDPTVDGLATGVAPGLSGGLSAVAPTHRVRVRLRISLGDGLYLEPDYRVAVGVGLDAAGTPASYVSHTAQVGVTWRR